MSSRLVPRRSAPMLSPALPSSSSLRNISTPVTTVLTVSLNPTISTSSPTLMIPRSTRPVTTVPRPEIVNTSSTGIEERLVDLALGLRDERIQRVHQLHHRRLADVRGVALERLERAAAHDRRVIAGVLVLGEQLAQLELHQIEQLSVLLGHHVHLVEVDDDRRHADLAAQQDVLARLRHRAVRSADHQDRAVHLRRARDHVLDVVGVTGQSTCA
jgi:hypothetical protein